MAYEIPGFSWTLPAGADFRTGAGQFRFVDVSTTGKAVAPSANGQVVGIRQNTPNTNEACTIVSSGVSFLEAAEAIAPGDWLSTDNTGRATVAAATEACVARALETATGAGIIIAVYLEGRAAVAP